MGVAVKRRLAHVRPQASWQGPVGAAAVVAALAVLTAWPWALLAVGVFLLLASAAGSG